MWIKHGKKSISKRAKIGFDHGLPCRVKNMALRPQLRQKPRPSASVFVYWVPRAMFFTRHGRPWSNPTTQDSVVVFCNKLLPVRFAQACCLRYIQYIPRNMHTVLLCFALLWLCNRSLWIHMKYLSIFIRVALLALGQSLDCHSASEVSLMDVGKSVNI